MLRQRHVALLLRMRVSWILRETRDRLRKYTTDRVILGEAVGFLLLVTRLGVSMKEEEQVFRRTRLNRQANWQHQQYGR